MATDRLTPIWIKLDSVFEEEHRPCASIFGSMPLYYYRNNADTNLPMPIVIRQCSSIHPSPLVNWITLNITEIEDASLILSPQMRIMSVHAWPIIYLESRVFLYIIQFAFAYTIRLRIYVNNLNTTRLIKCFQCF